MQHSDFVHLHLHTQYSLLDGACLLEPLMQKIRDCKMPACAMTDHGNMFGAIEFYDMAMKHGIKPIIGSEVYIAPNSRFEKSSHGIQDASFHLILLAKNETGYKNLMKLVSAGFLEGFYYRPRIDKEILAKYKDGLICTTACLKGEIPHLIYTNQTDQARKVIDEYKNLFGKENFYLEIQDNLIPEQEKVNTELITIARDMNIGLVATNDVHYLEKEHARAHETLLCIQTQTTLEDPNRMRLQTDEFYFKTKDQMSRKAFITVDSFHGFNHLAMAKEVQQKNTSIRNIFTYQDVRRMIGEKPDPRLSAIPIDGNDLFTICWTSGTEAQPKGCPLSHNNWRCQSSLACGPCIFPATFS